MASANEEKARLTDSGVVSEVSAHSRQVALDFDVLHARKQDASIHPCTSMYAACRTTPAESTAQLRMMPM